MKVLLQTDRVVVVDGPETRVDPRALAEALSLDSADLFPLDDLDAECAGLRLFARSPVVRDEIGAALAAGEAVREFRAIVSAPLWHEGVLEEAFAGHPATTGFERSDACGGWSELLLYPGRGGPAQVRFHLSRAGLPIAGDVRRGGESVSGALRLRCARIAVPNLAIDLAAGEAAPGWPDASPRERDAEPPLLEVSHATAVAVRRGHPWILPDAEMSDVERFRPGTLVQVRSVRGRALGSARIEGPGRIAARMWSSARGGERPASVEARVAAALKRRGALLGDTRTDALRLVHGEADGLPGLAVDRFGPALRVLLQGRACAPLVDRVCDALLRGLGDFAASEPAVVQVVQLADPPAGRLRGVRLLRGTLGEHLDVQGRLRVHERGLAFLVDLGVRAPYTPRPGTGLFLDQRDNRRRIARRATGGRWLNLFAHTGAFSVAALAAGAEEVVSVDLSAPYLQWLDANLAANAVEATRHRSERTDARRFLERLPADDCFDGIVCDPPTAARAGRRFWSVRSGGGEMVAACLRHLRSGGCLLVCRNDRGARATLEPLVRKVAAAQGIPLASVEAAPPGIDFPRDAGFPEGDAFEGVFATRA